MSRKYELPNEEKYYIKDWIIKAAFHAMGKNGNDDWLPKKLHYYFSNITPKNVDIDEVVEWISESKKNVWAAMFQGTDDYFVSDYNDYGYGLAFVVFYIDIKTGRVFKIETEDVEST